MDADKLISPEYRALNAELHSRSKFGSRGDKWADKVLQLMDRYAVNTVLDYGCGKGALKRAIALKFDGEVYEYDPAIPEKSDSPAPADLVVCTDVLEHIEPNCLDSVLNHLNSCTKKVLFIVVSTRPAGKILADGRNAHLIVEPSESWRRRLPKNLNVVEWEELEDAFLAVMIS